MVNSIIPDHYAALDLTKDATTAQIKTAYKKAALKHHPDKAKDNPNAGEQFHKISQAYETLVDEEKRRKYEDSIRIAALRRDMQERRGGGSNGFTRPAHSREGSGDFKYSSFSPRSPYTASAPFSASRVYEERRPRMWEDDVASRYEEARPTSRKYPEYTPSARPTATRAASSRGEDLPRKTSREEKPTAKSKAFTGAKKQHEQDIKRSRQEKYQPSVESDSSDSEDDYRSRRRDDWARQPPRRSRSRDAYEDNYAKARQYMGRAPSARSPGGSPPDYRREAFAREQPPPPSRDRPPPSMREDSYSSARPGLKRTNSSKQSDAGSVRPSLFREASHTRRDVADDRQRQRPPMQASASSPSDKIPQMSSNARRSTVPNSYEPPRMPPRRAETTPNLGRYTAKTAQYQPTANTGRRRSEQRTNSPLHGPSNLRTRHDNTDSGYSTSSPSEEAPPKKENIPTSTTKKSTFRFPSKPNDATRGRLDDTDSDDSEDEKTTVPKFTNPYAPKTELRTPGGARRTPHLSRSPSPMGERDVRRSRANSTSSTKNHTTHHGPSIAAERAAGPPPSLSAKYAHDHFNTGDRDSVAPPEVKHARRPSVGSRTTSFTRGIGRTNSMPIRPTVNTNVSSHGRDGLLFGETRETRTASPLDERMHRSDGERDRYGAHSDKEKAAADRARRSEDLPRKAHGISARKREDAKSEQAKQYMRDAAGRSSRVRGGLF